MTVYELIQELSKYDADAPVEVSYDYEDKYEYCPRCGTEVKIDGDDAIARSFRINRIGTKIYIEGKE